MRNDGRTDLAQTTRPRSDVMKPRPADAPTQGPDAPAALHLPDWRTCNPYLSLLAEGLRRNRWAVSFADFGSGLLPLRRTLGRRHRPAVVHLHWLDPYIARIFWGRSNWLSRVKCLLLGVDILWARARGTRVVWTCHNLITHENTDPEREIFARRVIAMAVSHIIFHSPSARVRAQDALGLDLTPKSSVVPHGNYIDYYPPCSGSSQALARQLSIGPDSVVVLLFGAIRNYKGAERLISACQRSKNHRLRLVVAGSMCDPAVQAKLAVAAQEDDRLRILPGHVADELVAPLFELAAVVAAPFKRTLTSGSVMLAMSLGKPLILSEAGRVLDVADHRGAFFYSDIDQLVDILDELPHPGLAAMGAHNRKVAMDLDWNTVGRHTAAVYAGQTQTAQVGAQAPER